VLAIWAAVAWIANGYPPHTRATDSGATRASLNHPAQEPAWPRQHGLTEPTGYVL
jgi:hypothetical protein